MCLQTFTVTSGKARTIIMTSIQISSEDTWKLSWIHQTPCKPFHTKHIRADSLCFGVCTSWWCSAWFAGESPGLMLDQAARLELCNFPYSSNPVPDSGSAHFGFLMPLEPWCMIPFLILVSVMKSYFLLLKRNLCRNPRLDYDLFNKWFRSRHSPSVCCSGTRDWVLP